MQATTLTALQPFVPGGADFAASRRLFAALDFVEDWEAGDVCGFRSGPVSFILQDFHDDHVAHNLMLRVVVPDIAAYDAFYKRMIAKIEIRDVSSAFAMEQIKYTTELPLDYMLLDNPKSGEE